MKKAGLGFILLVVMAGIALAAPPDFSGKWVINKEKSNFRFGPDGPTPDMTMTIEQTADAVKVSQHMSTERGDFDRDFTLNPDGQTREMPWFMNRPAKVTARWEGAALLVDSMAEMQGGQMQGTMKTSERWQLSADGKTLTIDSKMQGPMGEFDSKRVMEKQ